MVGYARRSIRAALRAAAVGVLLSTSLGAAAAPAPGTNTEASIPSANQGGIRDWRADGAKGMWIQAASGGWFYASFSSQCTTLPLALEVRFIPEPSGALSRWSSIRLEHDVRCFFRTLQPSDAPPRQQKDAPTKPEAAPGTPGNPTPVRDDLSSRFPSSRNHAGHEWVWSST
jgi:hypothetical protein